MSNPNYTLEIISHHPKFSKKNLRKYYVDGIDTVGAWGDEPFEIVFKNHTWQKVQVKLSVDGTDVLTGDKANTKASSEMWVVSGYGTLNLKAWPETNNGGAQLVFTSANNSVAVHTHGDLSSRGIIAAAVFVEGHVEPVRLNMPHVIITQPCNPTPYIPLVPSYPIYPTYPTYPIWYNTTSDNTAGPIGGSTFSTSSNEMVGRRSKSSTIDSFTSCSLRGVENQSYFSSNSIAEPSAASAPLESLAAVGAGQHIDQQITYVSGLIKPVFTETVRVRYMWWDDLVAKLREHNVPAPHASGFPGDKKQHVMSIGGTPRIGSFSQAAFPREQAAPEYLRV